MYDADLHRIAYKRVRTKARFRKHLGVYLVMGTFFFILNMLTDRHDLWFYWPMLGWGLGLSMHYLRAYGLPGSDPDEWEEKQMQKELARLERHRYHQPPTRRNETRRDEEVAMELKQLEKAYQAQKPYRDDELV
ncbi:MAG: 2TM domain-containing protein [Saprospiraceae bacterium]|nr:2TM domain-containing protein [Saprospiraceae bacterium]MCB9320163.1 2TM domain-containing protein [Lewinellaceae bacterium]